MRDLQKYGNECINDLIAIGINVPKIEKFVVNTRAKSRFGRCYHNIKEDSYKIEICNDLLDEECNVKALRETIFHELIHTLPNCMNHGTEFKKYAEIVNKKYFVNIKRCSSVEEKYGNDYAKKIKERNLKTKVKKRYELWCENCREVKASGIYARAPKWYAHAENYRCIKCGYNFHKNNAYIIKGGVY